MLETSICDWPATRLARQLRDGTLSSEALVRACLSRIAALDGVLRAFVTVDEEGALRAARVADARRAAGETLPALHGIPVAVKDVIATKGLRTTQGSQLFADHIPDRDAESVARLRRAGAVILGKTNTPEFAFGAVCNNLLCGPTANPWDITRSSGGSSGGSAAAVAAGMVPLALGTDFGGSVRTPAAFCGIVGLRPVPGAIPEPERALGEARLATQGVLARSIDDALLMLGAMAGPHPHDPLSQYLPPPPVPDTVQGLPLRLAASVDLGGAFAVDRWVRESFVQACGELRRISGAVIEASPNMEGGVAAFRTLRAAESWAKFGSMVEQNENALTPSYVWNVRAGRDIRADEYLKAEMVRTRVLRNALDFFDRYDALVLPAASVPPFVNDSGEVTQVGGQPCETIIDYLACTFLISLIGFPCLSIPAPMGERSLPFGLQLVAPPGREALLWGLARRLEQGGFVYQPSPLVLEQALVA